MPRAIASYQGNRRFETAVGDHTFTTDNAGAGPRPPDLFVASLAACIGIYVSGYCHKAGLDATGLTVAVDAHTSDDERRLTGFTASVNLPNAAVGPRLDALRRVAEACLLHETMRSFGDLPIEILDATSGAAAA